MPVLHSNYPDPPFYYLRNQHLETVLPISLRPVAKVPYERERLELPDGDFVLLDWWRQQSHRLVILSHGLEDDSQAAYMRGMARHWYRQGWDVLAWNYRTCGGEMNRLPRLYSHADSPDLHEVVQHALQGDRYRDVGLVGCSLGGSVTIRYVGEQGDALDERIRAAVAISAPVDMASTADALNTLNNYMYYRRFMGRLATKLEQKLEDFPDLVDLDKLKEVKRWQDFDEWFTAPVSGHACAADFYEDASCMPFIPGIRRPTLLLNALNDPILSDPSYPYELAQQHDHFYLETPERGGHVGFPTGNLLKAWSEERAFEFVHRFIDVAALAKR